jgi:hypothetical protein
MKPDVPILPVNIRMEWQACLCSCSGDTTVEGINQ